MLNILEKSLNPKPQTISTYTPIVILSFSPTSPTAAVSEGWKPVGMTLERSLKVFQALAVRI